MKIAILTSKDQWFIPYAQKLNDTIDKSEIFFDHTNINNTFDIVFILSYHKIIESKYLNQHNHNIIIHASELPMGKGWSPMFWQILEGKNKIIFTMFEAMGAVDNGAIYMKETLHLTGNELNKELRDKQATLTISMCIKFLTNYNEYKNPVKQVGRESFYKKRTPKDSELDINKSIKEQFNLLRIVDNEHYPAFFYKNNKKYILQIQEVNDEDS